MNCNHPMVMYEVMLSIQRLVNKYGGDLQEPAWSIVLDIVEEVITHTGEHFGHWLKNNIILSFYNLASLFQNRAISQQRSKSSRVFMKPSLV